MIDFTFYIAECQTNLSRYFYLAGLFICLNVTATCLGLLVISDRGGGGSGEPKSKVKIEGKSLAGHASSIRKLMITRKMF
jgi:hypothetical protein